MKDAKQEVNEKKLQDICDKAGIRMNELYGIVNQTYINEANLQEKIIKIRQSAYQQRQMDLLEVQLQNESITQQLLSMKLARKVKIHNFFAKIRKSFRKNGNKLPAGKPSE